MLATILLTIFVISNGHSYGRSNVHHNLITNKKVVIKNKASNKVLEVRGGVNGTQVQQSEHNMSLSQHFSLVAAGNGNFHILSANKLFLSLNNAQISSSESSTTAGSRVLMLDKKYSQRPACLTTAIANCPVNQLWKIKPVANES
jgi:hypothetical protein